MSDSLLKLSNPPFPITYKEKEHLVRKATIEKVVLYQERAQKLTEEKSAAADFKLAAYAFFLILKDAIPDLTEDDVLKNIPGDVDVLDVLTTLGFLNPAKAQTLLKMMVETVKKAETPTTPPSTAPSATEPDGPQA